MMDFNGLGPVISSICCIIDISIVTMDGLEVILIGCLVLLLPIRKKYRKVGEEMTNDSK